MIDGLAYRFRRWDVRRIMLVIDNFNEMVGLETLFRRLGFDVLSLSRESLVPEGILGFPPDLVVAVAHGRHVDGLHLGSKIRYGTTRPKLVVLLSPGEAPPDPEDPDIEVDAVIETPFDPREALQVVSTLLRVEPDPILEKYEKIVSARLFEPEELKIIRHRVEKTPLIHVTAGAYTPEPEPPRQTAREARYAKFLDDKAEEILPPIANSGEMRDARKKLADDEARASREEKEKAEKLVREKREFVQAMIATGQPADDSEEN